MKRGECLEMLNYYHIYTGLAAPALGKQMSDLPGSILFFGIFITVIGIISIIYPQLFWYLRIGRKLNGASPGKLYLWVLRFGGILVVAIGLFMIYSTGMIGS